VAGLGVAAVAVVGLVDPGSAGVYPPCPSRTVLGLDCALCGGLRGTHALLHGHVAAAVDHNLLLLPLLVAAALALALWLVPLTGRAAPAWRPPRWAAAAVLVVLGAFTVVRNLPVDALTWLDSAA
jgi:hypothetical protein